MQIRTTNPAGPDGQLADSDEDLNEDFDNESMLLGGDESDDTNDVDSDSEDEMEQGAGENAKPTDTIPEPASESDPDVKNIEDSESD